MSQINKNVLINDLSPYLRQHKDNPVNWQTWTNETIELAKQNKKPILLSIGYSSCHWYHCFNTSLAHYSRYYLFDFRVDMEPDNRRIYLG